MTRDSGVAHPNVGERHASTEHLLPLSARRLLADPRALTHPFVLIRWVPPPPPVSAEPPAWASDTSVSRERKAVLRQQAIWDSWANKSKDKVGLPAWFSHKTRTGFQDRKGRVW